MRWRAEAEFLNSMLPGSQVLRDVMLTPAAREAQPVQRGD
jgi:hypothetical protein